jgi:hypothetical protein
MHRQPQKPVPVSPHSILHPFDSGVELTISDLPLVLAAGGLAGLGGYVYLQRNPAVADKAEGKLKALQGDASASNESPAAAGALIKSVV